MKAKRGSMRGLTGCPEIDEAPSTVRGSCCDAYAMRFLRLLMSTLLFLRLSMSNAAILEAFDVDAALLETFDVDAALPETFYVDVAFLEAFLEAR